MKSFNEHILDKKKLHEEVKIPIDQDLWKKWKSLINMNSKELKEFYEKDFPGDTRKVVICNMIQKGKTFEEASSNWKSDDWKICKKQVSSIEKHQKMRKRLVGNPFEKNGSKTNWYKTLLSWGHNPRKN